MAMSHAAPSSERVCAFRERRRQAGLARVEVSVPADKADLIKAYAAQLREGSQSDRLAKIHQLVAKAYRDHYASCLDNISVDPEKADFADAAVVAAALMHRGNADAYKLGRQLRNLAK